MIERGGWERLFYIRWLVRTSHSDKVTFGTETCRKRESEPPRYPVEEHASCRNSKCKGPGSRRVPGDFEEQQGGECGRSGAEKGRSGGNSQL